VVTHLSKRLKYYSIVRLLTWHRFPFRCLAYRSAYPGASREPCEASWGHVLLFHAVSSANTLIRWVDENAFASIVQARPCPIFGRPVHHEMALSITTRHFSSNPPDSTSRWTPCPPGTTFPPWPARHYPRFWIQRPSSGRRRDFNPSEQYAAQRTLWARLTSSHRTSSA